MRGGVLEPASCQRSVPVALCSQQHLGRRGASACAPAYAPLHRHRYHHFPCAATAATATTHGDDQAHFAEADPSSEATFVVINQVLDEITQLFPDAHWGFGGDETCDWMQNTRVAAWARAKAGTTGFEKDLASYAGIFRCVPCALFDLFDLFDLPPVVSMPQSRVHAHTLHVATVPPPLVLYLLGGLSALSAVFGCWWLPPTKHGASAVARSAGRLQCLSHCIAANPFVKWPRVLSRVYNGGRYFASRVQAMLPAGKLPAWWNDAAAFNVSSPTGTLYWNWGAGCRYVCELASPPHPHTHTHTHTPSPCTLPALARPYQRQRQCLNCARHTRLCRFLACRRATRRAR